MAGCRARLRYGGRAHPAPVPVSPTPSHAIRTAATFDQAYYQRFYFNKKTRVIDPAHTERLGAFVCSYLHYLRVPVARVLDMGCGIGLWRDLIARHFPGASYHGVEISDYLCQRYGWEHGSVIDYAARTPFDLVICQGVLPYLDAPDLKRAMHTLGQLSHGALYLEAVSREDWEQDIGQTSPMRASSATAPRCTAARWPRALPRWAAAAG